MMLTYGFVIINVSEHLMQHSLTLAFSCKAPPAQLYNLSILRSGKQVPQDVVQDSTMLEVCELDLQSRVWSTTKS
jgi:hypothetical protein